MNCVPWVRGGRIAEMGYGMCRRMREGWLELRVGGRCWRRTCLRQLGSTTHYTLTRLLQSRPYLLLSLPLLSPKNPCSAAKAILLKVAQTCHGLASPRPLVFYYWSNKIQTPHLSSMPSVTPCSGLSGTTLPGTL